MDSDFAHQIELKVRSSSDTLQSNWHVPSHFDFAHHIELKVRSSSDTLQKSCAIIHRETQQTYNTPQIRKNNDVKCLSTVKWEIVTSQATSEAGIEFAEKNILSCSKSR